MCDLHSDSEMAERHRQEALDDIALLAVELGYDVDAVDPERAERARKSHHLVGSDNLEERVWRLLCHPTTYRSPDTSGDESVADRMGPLRVLREAVHKKRAREATDLDAVSFTLWRLQHGQISLDEARSRLLPEAADAG